MDYDGIVRVAALHPFFGDNQRQWKEEQMKEEILLQILWLHLPLNEEPIQSRKALYHSPFVPNAYFPHLPCVEKINYFDEISSNQPSTTSTGYFSLFIFSVQVTRFGQISIRCKSALELHGCSAATHFGISSSIDISGHHSRAIGSTLVAGKAKVNETIA
ncbi:uncharacterized protein MONOS_17483 [Monocercomonoides exilis]|uniref:uncharacterized protein n=1 Tax=Monocercomonoides exilis TaxID=2049356 RepID=UPI0035594D97|nr:hypothetical protein MONOS_17483 [Monocercomonoides exilis]